MCIVIDASSFGAVFQVTAKDHSQFRPVLKWITTGKGTIVYGGTKYKQELAKARNLLGVLGEFERAGKIVELDTARVNRVQRDVEQTIQNRHFDDPHIAAIVIVSGCRLVCTKDKRSCPFIGRADLYPKGVKKPRFYCSSRNKDLFKDKDTCRPTSSSSRDLRNLFDL